MASQTLSAPDFVAPRRHRRKRRPGAPRKFNHSKACALRAAGVPVSVIARKFKVSVLPIYLATAAERRPETFEGVKRFMARAARSGFTVTSTAVELPEVDIRGVAELSRSLGARYRGRIPQRLGEPEELKP